MLRRPLRSTLLALTLACAAAAQEPPAPAALREWVAALASKDEAARARAEALLVDAGEAALPALDVALKKEPPGSELHRRLQEVRGKAETGRWTKLLARGKHTLPGQPFTPVALSPDGASALYYRGVEKPDGPRSYELVVAGLEEDELAVRCVVPTTVPNDDFLVNQVRACSWSRDSKRFAVLTADAGAPRGQFRAGHASFDGAVTTLAPKTLLSTHDLAFDPQGDRAWYLETTGYERTDQAKWMLIELDLKTGATKTLKEGQDQMVIDLTVSPDGKRLAWLSVDMNQRACAMSVLDLATQAVKSGPPFQGDDYHWDGPPLQFWTADSTRLVYQGRGAERRKRPSIVTVLDAATCEARLLDPQAQYDVLGTIGAGHAMVHQRELGAGVLDLEKGAVLWVKDGGLLLDQRGARRVVAVPPGREVTIE